MVDPLRVRLTSLSKLYLSGIEIWNIYRREGVTTPTPNCTLVELKYLEHHCITIIGQTPNCTLVELKSVSILVSMELGRLQIVP